MDESGRGNEASVSIVSPTLCTKSIYKTKLVERAVLLVSSLQIMIGVVCIVLQSVTLYYGVRQAKLAGPPDYNIWNGYNPRYPLLSDRWSKELYAAPGIWVGVIYIVTGFVGVFSVLKNNKGLVIGMMISNIVMAAGCCTVMIGMMGNLISYLSDWDCKGYDEKSGRYIITTRSYYGTTTVSYFDCDKTPRNVSIILEIIMLVLSVLNIGIAVSLSVVGCCYACSCCKEGTNQQQQALPYQMAIYQNGAYPQQGYVMAQPGVVFSQAPVVQPQQPVTQQAPINTSNYNQAVQQRSPQEIANLPVPVQHQPAV